MRAQIQSLEMRLRGKNAVKKVSWPAESVEGNGVPSILKTVKTPPERMASAHQFQRAKYKLAGLEGYWFPDE